MDFPEAQSSFGIGILDTLISPDDEFEKFNQVGRTTKLEGVETDQLANGAELTGSHGITVTGIPSSLAQNQEYHFFNAIPKGGEFRDRHLLEALDNVLLHSDEIDLLNISAGLDHITDPSKDCDIHAPSCAVCDVIESVMEEDIIVVAGAGNQPLTENVCCPSLSRHVISVGGAVIKCTASITDDDLFIDVPDRPPNSIWVRRDDDNGLDETLCSNRGCAPGLNCTENRSVELWNPTPVTDNGKPDVAAPCVFPVDQGDGVVLSAGTSYSTPFVAANIANSLHRLRDFDAVPSPPAVRASVTDTAEPIAETDIGLFQVDGYSRDIASKYGLDLEIDDSETGLL